MLISSALSLPVILKSPVSLIASTTNLLEPVIFVPSIKPTPLPSFRVIFSPFASATTFSTPLTALISLAFTVPPAVNSKVSFPFPPTITSADVKLTASIKIVSLSSPLEILSLPEPAFIVSSPANEFTISLPPPTSIISLALPPVTMSFFEYVVIVFWPFDAKIELSTPSLPTIIASVTPDATSIPT